MKTCYVIMPFGGDDEGRERFFLGIYQGLLAPAAERAGYQVTRSDLGGAPGNITNDIIRDLANADIVIADLTGGNANVLFELGIRHALRKSGTIHVIDKALPIPFDVGQYRAVKYSTDLADIPATIDEIVKAIHVREQNPTRSDNPVHDALVDLPSDYRMLGNDLASQQLNDLQNELDSVRQDRDTLDKKLSELDPAGTVRGATIVDVDALFDQADEIMRSTGDYVVLRLKDIAEEQGRDAFVSELRSIIKSPYLVTNDLLELARMCVELNLEDHRRAVLEVAHDRYPQNEPVLVALVDAYDDSSVPAVQERGRIMLEQYLHVRRMDNGRLGIAHDGNSGPINTTAFGILLNTYFSANRQDRVLEVCESALEQMPNDSMFLRNKARALSELHSSEADDAFTKALEVDSGDYVLLGWYSSHLAGLRRYAEAYEAAERCIVCDPSSANSYINLAISIINDGYCRRTSGDIQKIAGGGDAALRAAIPFLIAATELGNIATKQRVVNMLVRRGAIREARAIADGETPQGRYDTAPIDYMRKLLDDAESAEIDGSTDVGTDNNDFSPEGAA